MQLLGIEEVIENSEDVFQTEVVSLARENYKKDYDEEMRLNNGFNVFVLNYKSAYEGRNTRQDQLIGTTVSKKHLSSMGEYNYYTEIQIIII